VSVTAVDDWALFHSSVVPWAGTAFIAAGVLGVLLIGWSYRRTTPGIRGWRRWLLIVLRCAFLLVLLGCLADPVRVEQVVVKPPPPEPEPVRTLAVIVDRSDSMTRTDNRGVTRLSDALATWRRFAPAAQRIFAKTEYFTVGSDLRPALSLDAAQTRTGGTGETNLFDSVAGLLASPPSARPDAIVVLTDGVDTSGKSESTLRERSLAAGVPLYFAAGTNRSRQEPFLSVREWRAPAVALENSRIIVNATFESFSRDDRPVTFTLWKGDQSVAQGQLHLTLGWNLAPGILQVQSGPPGMMDLKLRFGTTADSPVVARSLIRVEARRRIRVLIDQGALDWGFHFLQAALHVDSRFAVTALLNLGPEQPNAAIAADSAQAIAALPDTVEGYQAFDCVVLARIDPSLMTSAQQQALVQFVQGGGGLLFAGIAPGDVANFTVKPLADLLPVTFDASVYPADSNPKKVMGSDLDGTMELFAPVVPQPHLGQVDPSLDAARHLAVDPLIRDLRFNAAEAAERAASRTTKQPSSFGGAAPEVVVLHSFRLTPAGQASPIFALGSSVEKILPQFVDYDPGAKPKAGAEVLANDPAALDPKTGQPAVLFATQTFGEGRTVLLNTDGLSRWKLNEPSASKSVETFWQQLLLTLGQRKEVEPLRFGDVPAQSQMGDPIQLRLTGSDSKVPPEVTATAPDHRLIRLDPRAVAGTTAQWQFGWKPDQPGLWTLAANVAGASPVYDFPAVIAQPKGELANTPTATELMRSLAWSTGGELLAHDIPLAWRRGPSAPGTIPDYERRERHQAWNRWPVLLAALGLFALELILRRRWKLV